MLVAHTSGSIIAKNLMEVQDKFAKNNSGGKVKIVKRGGI